MSFSSRSRFRLSDQTLSSSLSSSSLSSCSRLVLVFVSLYSHWETSSSNSTIFYNNSIRVESSWHWFVTRFNSIFDSCSIFRLASSSSCFKMKHSTQYLVASKWNLQFNSIVCVLLRIFNLDTFSSSVLHDKVNCFNLISSFSLTLCLIFRWLFVWFFVWFLCLVFSSLYD